MRVNRVFSGTFRSHYRSDYFKYIPLTGEWIVVNKVDADRVKSDSEYGTRRMEAPAIILRLLNGKVIEVKDKELDKSVRNPQETIAAQEKAQKIQNEFKEWIWQDEERATRLSRVYNDTFNNFRPRSFDGQHQDLPGLTNKWAKMIHPHIKDAIWRTVQDRTVLFAHEVGFGKTSAMVGSGMELRRLGLARKNLYVVPKAIHKQFKKDFQDMYPYANILFPDDTDFSPENRQEFVSRVATGDWDAVLISDSQFRRIPVKPETQAKFISEEIDNIRAAIIEEESENPHGKSRSHKDLMKILESAKARLEEATAKSAQVTDKTIFFEDLGVDQMFVDEADMYKNLHFPTRMGRIKGLPNSNSERAWDMYQKVRYLQEQGDKSGVVFATGTPVANTVAEMYTMQRYLQGPTLEAKGINHFDAWARTFGETTESLEQTPTGDYKLTSRFAKFKNMSELSAMWQEVADIRVAEEVPGIVKLRPRLVDEEGRAKRTVIPIQPDDQLKKYMADLAERADELPHVDPRDDNILKIASDARLASLDMRMVKPDATPNPDGKIATASRKIAEVYGLTHDKKGTQLVFLDLGTPKAEKEETKPKEAVFDDDGNIISDSEEGTAEEQKVLRNVYKVMKDNLIASGVPENEIAFIHDAKTTNARKNMYDKVNDGTVRVIIGSTSKMGVGVNIQKRAAALHHMDAPWRPRDIEQREGRIIRQGNELYGPEIDQSGKIIDPGPGIKVYTYVTEKSFDAYMWQAIEAKSRAIKSIMRRENPPREIEDIDSFTMSAGEAKAVASGNPDVMKLVTIRDGVNRLQMLHASHTDAKVRANTQIQTLPKEIESLSNSISNMDKDAKAIPKGDFNINVKGTTYTERPEAGKALAQTVTQLPFSNQPTDIGKYKGFTIKAINQGEGIGYKLIIHSPETKMDYQTTDIAHGDITDAGIIQRIDNKINGIPATLEKQRKELERAEANLQNYKKQAEVPFEHQSRLAVMSDEMSRLEKKLQGDKEVSDQPSEIYTKLTEEPLKGEEAPAYRYGAKEGELSIDKVPPGLPALIDPVDTDKEVNVVYGAKNDPRENTVIADDMQQNDPIVSRKDWQPDINDLSGWDTTDIKEHQEQYEQVFTNAKNDLEAAFKSELVEGRVKTLPSIVKKLKKKNKGDEPFTQNNMEDIAALRVTFDSLDDLKAGVTASKARYKILDDEDYVTTPNQGYRSYHLTIEKDGKPVEVQFRTPNMTKWADWTHNTLYDHTEATKEKVGDKGFKDLQDYSKDMSKYYQDVDDGKSATMPHIPDVVAKVGGPMEPKPEPKQATYQHPTGPTGQLVDFATIPDSYENKAMLFKPGGENTQWMDVDRISARPSPQDAVERSRDKAIATLKGEYEPRDPLDVWEVTRPDGSKFYSLRDGNTTFQFLTSQRWLDVPVNITNKVKLEDLPPVKPYERTTQEVKSLPEMSNKELADALGKKSMAARLVTPEFKHDNADISTVNMQIKRDNKAIKEYEEKIDSIPPSPAKEAMQHAINVHNLRKEAVSRAEEKRSLERAVVIPEEAKKLNAIERHELIDDKTGKPHLNSDERADYYNQVYEAYTNKDPSKLTMNLLGDKYFNKLKTNREQLRIELAQVENDQMQWKALVGEKERVVDDLIRKRNPLYTNLGMRYKIGEHVYQVREHELDKDANLYVVLQRSPGKKRIELPADEVLGMTPAPVDIERWEKRKQDLLNKPERYVGAERDDIPSDWRDNVAKTRIVANTLGVPDSIKDEAWTDHTKLLRAIDTHMAGKKEVKPEPKPEQKPVVIEAIKSPGLKVQDYEVGDTVKYAVGKDQTLSREGKVEKLLPAEGKIVVSGFAVKPQQVDKIKPKPKAVKLEQKPKEEKAEGEKQPWEMSRDEFINTQYPPNDRFKTYSAKINKYRESGDEKIRGAATGNMLAEQIEKQADTIRKFEIKHALFQGKPVPPEVQNDYLDLIKPKVVKPEPKPVEVTAYKGVPKTDWRSGEPITEIDATKIGKKAAKEGEILLASVQKKVITSPTEPPKLSDKEARKLVLKVQEGRSKRSIALDQAKEAKTVLTLDKVEKWAKHPNRSDLEGVDVKKPKDWLMKEPKLPTNPKYIGQYLQSGKPQSRRRRGRILK